jgi:hypothetical protein
LPPEWLSRAALARYELAPARVRPLEAEVLRADADDGRRYALHARPRAARTFGDIPLDAQRGKRDV